VTEKQRGPRGLRVFSVLAGNRPLQVFWFGDLISVFGNVMAVVALPFYTLELTGSPGLMGVAVAVQWLPGLFVRLLAGVVIDRVDRRKLLMWISLLQAVPPLVIVMTSNLALLYGVVFIAGILQQVVFPALFAVLPGLVSKDDLLPANALFSTSRTLSQIVGASLAGAVVSFLGAKWAFVLDASSFVIFGLLLATLPGLPAQPAEAKRNILADLRAGLAYAWGNPVVRSICALGLLGMFTVMGSGLALVVLCTEQWQVGAVGYGVLSTTAAVGSLVASLSVGSWGERFSQHRLVVGGFLAKGLSFLTLGLVPVYAVALPMRFVAGAAMPVWNVPLDAYLQKTVAPNMLGRVYSLTGISVSLGMVLGGLLGGSVTESVGGENLLVAMGLLAVAVLALLVSPLKAVEAGVVTADDQAPSAAGS